MKGMYKILDPHFTIFDFYSSGEVLRSSGELPQGMDKVPGKLFTHNFKTMEEADYIYGITMNEPGISTIYSMKMTGKDGLEKI